MENQPRERSLFWPIMLIGAGTIWLLVNYNVIQGFDWWQLLRLWPLFLIAAGLELLLGRGRPLVSALVGLLTVGAAVALIYFAPQLGLSATRDVQTEHLEAPLDNAASATINLDLASYATDVQALTDADRLITADLTFSSNGDASLETQTTGSETTVTLEYTEAFGGPWDWFSGAAANWDIGLSAELPLDLNVDVGSGTAYLNLAGLQLTDVNIDGGSGALRLDLPPGDGDGAYAVRLDGGSGASLVTVGVDTHATLEYDGGSGALTLEVPSGLAVRVEVQDGGSGSVRLPNDWETVRDDGDDEGIWQTAGFETAARQFVLVVSNLGSGSIIVH